MGKLFKRSDGASLTVYLAPEELDAFRGMAGRLNISINEAARHAINTWVKDCQNEIDRWNDYAERAEQLWKLE